MWEKKVDEFVKRETYLEQNMKTLYSLVWGQCTDAMRQKVEATNEFEKLSSNGDGLGLLRIIKDLVYNFQSQKYLSQAPHETTRSFYLCYQNRHMTTPIPYTHRPLPTNRATENALCALTCST